MDKKKRFSYQLCPERYLEAEFILLWERLARNAIISLIRLTPHETPLYFNSPLKSPYILSFTHSRPCLLGVAWFRLTMNHNIPRIFVKRVHLNNIHVFIILLQGFIQGTGVIQFLPP